jgi:elongation factor P hydroxylase
MILTPIAPDRLDDVLDRFAAGLATEDARAAFALVRTSSAERAEGAEAERHRLRALDFARARGLAVHPEGTECAYNWDGAALDGATEAYVILHEVAHYLLAPPERRALPDFGLGPGPDTRDRDGAERAAAVAVLTREADEAAASLLGILWEAELGQPALASLLDQNWLEGLERSAAAHFTEVAERLVAGGLWSNE